MTYQPDTLWFFWGQKHMSFLRYMTLLSATKVHKNIVLVLRRGEGITMNLGWVEKQDCNIVPLTEHVNYMAHAEQLPIEIIYLEDVSPDIAKFKAPDVHTSDMLSWWLLSHYGGTVADMDIIFIKPLPEIKEAVQVVKFSGAPKKDYVTVAFLQGRPDDVWLDAYKNSFVTYDPAIYQSCGSKCFKGEAGQLPECIVFPWAGHSWIKYRPWLFEANDFPNIPVDCVGIHWYAGRNQDYNQKINGPDDLGSGAVASAIRKVLK